MPDYRRARVSVGTYFFTVAIAERRRSLLTHHIDDLRHAFRVAHAARPLVIDAILIDAIVIVPDHLHCLWPLPPGDADFSVRWAHIKQACSRPGMLSSSHFLVEFRGANIGVHHASQNENAASGSAGIGNM